MMNDKRELNDILIGGDDSRSKDNKKLIVLIIGIVVLVLAIAIIAIAMTNTKSNETIVVDSTTTKADANLPQNDFTNMNVDNSDEDRFEQIVRDMKKNTESTPSANTQPPIATQPAQPVIRQEAPKATMPNKPARVAPTTTSKPIITTTPRRNTLNNGDIAESGYYLQVGAFSKTPNKDFINSINKYSYRVQEIMINSNVITRYLVGPYTSREEAQKDFDRVNRDIARPVFLQVQ